MYQLTRKIPFCYGHRLIDHPGKCKNLHGHNAVAEIVLESAGLNGEDMVCDFEEIKTKVAVWINETLDHKMILYKEDPIVPSLEACNETYLGIDANPTAEVLAKLIFDYALATDLPVVEVRLWETDSAMASYRAE